jgi:hypothetical protein
MVKRLAKMSRRDEMGQSESIKNIGGAKPKVINDEIG